MNGCSSPAIAVEIAIAMASIPFKWSTTLIGQWISSLSRWPNPIPFVGADFQKKSKGIEDNSAMPFAVKTRETTRFCSIARSPQ